MFAADGDFFVRVMTLLLARGLRVLGAQYSLSLGLVLLMSVARKRRLELSLSLSLSTV